MKFRLLGPVEARVDGRPVRLGGGKPKALLGALLVERGRGVSTASLMEAVWGADLPDTAHALVQTYVCGLRRSFERHGGGASIITRPPGYLLRVPNEAVDSDVFEGLVREGRKFAAEGQPQKAGERLRAGLALWHGPALGDLDTPFFEAEAARLNELRLGAVEQRVAADLAVGRLDELSGELAALVARHPTRERLRGYLMIALYRLGRQTDALARYREGRETLVDELGIEPGPELEAIHRAILSSDKRLLESPPSATTALDRPYPNLDRPRTALERSRTALERPRTALERSQTELERPRMDLERSQTALERPHPTLDSPCPTPAGPVSDTCRAQENGGPPNGRGLVRPENPTLNDTPSRAARPLAVGGLPPVPADFTGRGRELAEVTASLRPRPGTVAVPIHVIAGTAGTGKTTIAARAAAEVADEYPDGLLYAELNGMTDAPAQPIDILGRFLRVLGVDPEAIAGTVEERTGQYRSRLAEARVLVVLDDARSSQQVTPLLPGTAGCGVLVTARDRLAELPGATRTELDILDADAAVRLLAHVIGDDRPHGEMDAAELIVDRCGYLPLAIRLAGARLVARRRWPLSLLADRLADERRRLDELEVGGQSVRASIAPSYRLLAPEAQTALRRLAVLGMPHFPAWIMGPLLGRPGARQAECEAIVEALVDANLVDFLRVDAIGQLRYQMHGLVRLFAGEVATAEEARADLRTAIARLSTAWLDLAGRAAAVSPSGELWIREPSRSLAPVPAEVVDGAMADPGSWLGAERDCLARTMDLAASWDLHETAREAATVLRVSRLSGLDLSAAGRRASATDTEAVTRMLAAAVAAAGRATGDAADRAADRAIDRAADEADGRVEDVPDGRVDDVPDGRHTRARALAELALLTCEQGEFRRARDLFVQALDGFQEAGDVEAEAVILAGLGTACHGEGRLLEAMHFAGRSVTLSREHGDDVTTGHGERVLGMIHLELGEYEAARAGMARSVEAYRRAGSERGEAMTRRDIGFYHRARGEWDEAARCFTAASLVFRRCGDALLAARTDTALGKTRVRQARYAEAQELVEGALDTARELGDRQGSAVALRTLGDLHLSESRLDRAEAYLRESLGAWEGLEQPLGRARTLCDLARVYEQRGEEPAAAAVLLAALDVFREHGAREYAELTGGDPVGI